MKQENTPKREITRKANFQYASSKKALKFQSKIASGEKKDCFVYALATALGISYDQAHTIAKERFKRADKKGTKNGNITVEMNKLIETKEVLHGKIISQEISTPATSYKCYGEIVPRLYRVYTFAEKFKEGTYLVLVRAHALVVKDGVIIDNNAKPAAKSLVERAYKIEDAPVAETVEVE